MMIPYTDLLAELEAIRARRHDRDYQDWLERVAAIVCDAGMELAADLDRYDERQARRRVTDAELDREARARDMADECRTWERGE